MKVHTHSSSWYRRCLHSDSTNPPTSLALSMSWKTSSNAFSILAFPALTCFCVSSCWACSRAILSAWETKMPLWCPPLQLPCLIPLTTCSNTLNSNNNSLMVLLVLLTLFCWCRKASLSQRRSFAWTAIALVTHKPLAGMKVVEWLVIAMRYWWISRSVSPLLAQLDLHPGLTLPLVLTLTRVAVHSSLTLTGVPSTLPQVLLLLMWLLSMFLLSSQHYQMKEWLTLKSSWLQLVTLLWQLTGNPHLSLKSLLSLLKSTLSLIQAGTTTHISHCVDDFSHLVSIPPRSVCGVGGSAVTATGMGIIHLLLNDSIPLILHCVLYVPASNVCLISIPALCDDDGYVTTFSVSSCCIHDQSASLIVTGQKTGNCSLYILSCKLQFVHQAHIAQQVSSLATVGKAAAQDNGLSERRILTGLLLLKSSRS